MIRNTFIFLLNLRRLEKCLVVGMDKYKNKTLRPRRLERNEKFARQRRQSHYHDSTYRQARRRRRSGCDQHRYDWHRGDSDHRQKCTQHRLCHHPLKFLTILGLNIILHHKCISVMYQVSSFFIEVSTYTTLPQTVIGDILNVWILGSVGRNLIQ